MGGALSAAERRHGMGEFTDALHQFKQALLTISNFVSALNELTKEIQGMKTDLALVKQQSNDADEKAEEALNTLNGRNGTKGMKVRLERAELYIGIIIGVFVTGGGGALVFIVSQTIKNAYAVP